MQGLCAILDDVNRIGFDGTYAVQYQNCNYLTQLSNGLTIESVIDDFYDNTIFESTNNTDDSSENEAPKENIFKRILNKILKAIEGFIEGLQNMFSGKKAIDAEEYFKSSTAKIKMKQDVKEINRIVDDEIRKGSKLLQLVSSKTGISDEAIDKWIGAGTAALKTVGPAVVPAAIGFGFRTIFRKQAGVRKDKLSQLAEFVGDVTDKMGKSSKKKQSQKEKILSHINKLNNFSISKSKGFMSNLFHMANKKEGE